MIGKENNTVHFGFYLAPDFCLMAFSSAIEPLRIANAVLGKEYYSWSLISSDGSAVSCSNGVAIAADIAAGNNDRYDAVFVCGGKNTHRLKDKKALQWIRYLADQGTVLGALFSGTFILARAGVLTGRRCTIHWEFLPRIRKEFSQLDLSTQLFEIDHDRYTCADGFAAMDMFLDEIRNKHGADISDRICERLLITKIRNKNDRQCVPVTNRVDASPPQLIDAVSIMRANIEEPIRLDDLARLVGISRRHLTLLFQNHMQCNPAKYYMQLRVDSARKMLLDTGMPIGKIGYACGFTSATRFTKCYKNLYSIPPSDERRLATGLLERSTAH